MKTLFITLLVILTSVMAVSQDYKSEFEQYWETNDTVNQLSTLKKWHSERPNDAELFTSYFNYYFLKSREEVIALTTEKPDGESLSLQDSLNQNKGFLKSQIRYNTKEVQKGLDKIDQGIALYPNRLDMRFGKIYALGQIKDWESFTYEILKTVSFSNKNNNEWTWTNNVKQENGKEFFLSSLQDYQVQLYNTGIEELLINMRDIANKILEFYPDHIESLSNLSITYLLTGEYDKGIDPLLKAEKINPKDYIVLSNIAQGYKLKGENKKAIEYYKKTAEYGDASTKEFAEKQIAELKK